jgi:hypothetical protein
VGTRVSWRPGQSIRRTVPLTGAMGTVTVRCPVTHEQVSTGVVFDAESFVIVSFEAHRFRCDACGAVHQWSKRDATYHHHSSL